MKKIISIGLALVLSLSFSGCATTAKNQAMLTFETAPEGATIYEGGDSVVTSDPAGERRAAVRSCHR